MAEREEGRGETERPVKAATRSERLAAALRDNLRKRKAQARARAGDVKESGGTG